MKERTIYFAVGPFATDAGVVMAPSADDWPKRHDEVRLRCRFVMDDDFSHLSPMPLDRFLAWGNDGLEAKSRLSYRILSNGKAEKVESRCALFAVERMRDACFTWFQFQPHLCELLGNNVLALFYYGAVVVDNDQVVGVADDLGGFLWAGQCVLEGVFEPMKGDICQ